MTALGATLSMACVFVDATPGCGFRTFPIYPAGEAHALKADLRASPASIGREPAFDSLSAQNSLPRGGAREQAADECAAGRWTPTRVVLCRLR